MAKNYIKQFMEDNGLEIGTEFKILDATGTPIDKYIYFINSSYTPFQYIDGFAACSCDSTMSTMFLLIQGSFDFMKLEPKAKKIEKVKIGRYLIEPEVVEKINEIIDAVNGLIEEK